jgi:type II secretory pathway predicted ATPase ExeA
MHQAFAMLDSILGSPNVIGVLTGARGSGREATLRGFAADLTRRGIPTAIVDGRGMDRAGLLREILSEFGYDADGLAVDDLFGILRVFLIHRALADEPPFLGVLHVAEMQPSALCELCRLAAIETAGEKPLRLALSGDRRVEYLLAAPSTDALRERSVVRFELQPMDLVDVGRYVDGRLATAGALSQRAAFTDEIIARLWHASGGLPDKLDALIRKVLAAGPSSSAGELVAEITAHETVPETNQTSTPVPSSAATEPAGSRPRVVVTLNGEPVLDRGVGPGLILIGRETDCDICLPGRYVSRRHAMLIVGNEEAKIFDLRSTNGVLIDGQRTSVAVLRDECSAQLGGYRLRFVSRGHSAAVDVEAERHSGPESSSRRRILERVHRQSRPFSSTVRATPSSLVRVMPGSDSGGLREEGPGTL